MERVDRKGLAGSTGTPPRLDAGGSWLVGRGRAREPDEMQRGVSNGDPALILS